MFRKASNNRNWKEDFSKQACVSLKDELLQFSNIRNNEYPEPMAEYNTIWEDREYNLSKLRKLWLVLEPFHPSISGIAHPFLSFEFEDDFLCLSIEARTTKDENYSIIKGLFRNYELIYSYGTEKDFFIRRAYYQNHDLYLYPLVTPPLEILTLLLVTVVTANSLIRTPRFYNSARNNCTTTLRRHANQVRPGSFPPFLLADFLPGLSDKILYKKSWIDTDVGISELRQKHSIKSLVNKYRDSSDFSHLIRGRQ